MELHGICRFVELKIEGSSLLLLGENHNPKQTMYDRYHKNNIISYLIDLFKDGTKYNLYSEDEISPRERYPLFEYSNSPLWQISDIFRYGEYNNLNYIPIDIRKNEFQSLILYIKKNKDMNQFSMNMTEEDVLNYNKKFNKRIKPYMRDIFNYITCKDISKYNKRRYNAFFKLMLETYSMSPDKINLHILDNNKYREHIINMINSEKEGHSDLKKFYNVLYESLFRDLTPLKCFDLFLTVEMDIYFLMKFTKLYERRSCCLFAGALHVDNISKFIKMYYNIKSEVSLECEYNENIVI
jgi:hypothetical protein